MVRDYYPLLGYLEGKHLPEDQRPRTSSGATPQINHQGRAPIRRI